LVPGGDATDIALWLEAKRAVWQEGAAIAVVALVGHEPELGALAASWLCGTAGAWMPIKKGGVVAIDFADRVVPGRGRLVFSAPPSVLRNVREERAD
jgi:phosphohistidine phosphatase